MTDFKNFEESSNAWLEHSPVCTKIVDLDFNLQYMSSAGIDKLKIEDITKCYGKPYPFDFYPESFRDEMEQNLRIAKATGEIVEQEASVVDREGGELWFHSTIVPVDDDQGQMSYIMIVSIETTERKRLEIESQKQIKELEKMNDLMIGREDRILEMKQEINALSEELGRSKPYRTYS